MEKVQIGKRKEARGKLRSHPEIVLGFKEMESHLRFRRFKIISLSRSC